MSLRPSPISALPQETQDDFESSYLHIRFRGGRFDGGGGMPLAAMSELSHLNTVIIEVSRVLWRRSRNVKRARDYPAEPTLRISRFAKGSTIPLVERDGASGMLTGDPYDLGAELVQRAFREIVSDFTLPDDFPRECVDSLRSVGKGLQADEVADFLEKDSSGVWVERQFTKQTRDDFWTHFTKPSRKRVKLLGQVVSLSRAAETYVFERSKQKLDGNFIGASMWDDLHAALGRAENHPYCRIDATVEVDYMNRVRKILQTHKVEVIEVQPASWKERFIELASYGQDWIPGANPVEAESLERTDRILATAIDMSVPPPIVFASAEGGINLVWDHGGSRTTLYVEPDEPLEVEHVPDGPLYPFTTTDPREALRAAKEFIDG